MSRARAAKAQRKTNQMSQENTIAFSQAPKVAQRRIDLVPRTRNQEALVLALQNPDACIVVTTGPAGTGKTYLAVQAAVKALKEGQCDRIVMTRPAVGVEDERHGFLPGNLVAKMEPWTRPLFDVMGEYYDRKELAKMLDEQVIEISPLAFMRGRTFKNSWIIGDEMQNATPNQMKMLLTRLGENSKMVITGDTRQADRTNKDNGLLDFRDLVDSYAYCKYVAGVELSGKDIQRHPAVVEVLKIYREWD